MPTRSYIDQQKLTEEQTLRVEEVFKNARAQIEIKLEPDNVANLSEINSEVNVKELMTCGACKSIPIKPVECSECHILLCSSHCPEEPAKPKKNKKEEKKKEEEAAAPEEPKEQKESEEPKEASEEKKKEEDSVDKKDVKCPKCEKVLKAAKASRNVVTVLESLKFNLGEDPVPYEEAPAVLKKQAEEKLKFDCPEEGCDHKELSSAEMAEHLSSECKKLSIECQYCLHKYVRPEIDNKDLHHCEQNIKEEMEKLSREVEDSQSQVQSLKTQVESTKNETKNLESQKKSMIENRDRQKKELEEKTKQLEDIRKKPLEECAAFVDKNQLVPYYMGPDSLDTFQITTHLSPSEQQYRPEGAEALADDKRADVLREFGSDKNWETKVRYSDEVMAYIRVKAKKPIVLNGFALCPKDNNNLPTDPVKVQFWAKLAEAKPIGPEENSAAEVKKEEQKEEERAEEKKEPESKGPQVNQADEADKIQEKTDAEKPDDKKEDKPVSKPVPVPAFAKGMTLLKDTDSFDYPWICNARSGNLLLDKAVVMTDEVVFVVKETREPEKGLNLNFVKLMF